jgi:hypothetical protein
MFRLVFSQCNYSYSRTLLLFLSPLLVLPSLVCYFSLLAAISTAAAVAAPLTPYVHASVS